MDGFWTRLVLRIWVVLILLFLFIPILLIFFYAFNASNIQSWPIPGLTLKWFSATWDNGDVRSALVISLQAGLAATAIALVLGSCAAFAIHRTAFFGREVVSLLFILPLALPGIITGIALNAFFSFNGISLSLWTIVVGHTTFCIVVVYNNVIARLRRTQGSLVEASGDLGADGWQTFRFVSLPAIRTALVAGALLAFALSFDEIVVTNFTSGAELTVPKFIYDNVRQPRNRPIVNVVAVIAVLLMLIPVYIAQRLAGGAAYAGRVDEPPGG
jgi:putative spermidine/putrescine transport system permease protein